MLLVWVPQRTVLIINPGGGSASVYSPRTLVAMLLKCNVTAKMVFVAKRKKSTFMS